ncbi:hypothetical protein JR316_0010414 [Psilocybe cubensis]|uniref:Uncharacterized protein n=2 Tax=Psilocybe cubensis TaxID=181762 RepID=A0ACB8GM77_PSICU|nr:hypothetical protein JR316_0010414 [Psilocybe cubensis]KAH9476502.1 hypothetical protein JR316_0010414 [Psilocybe cubensis]
MSMLTFSGGSAPVTKYLSYTLPSSWEEVMKKGLTASSRPNAWTLFNTWRSRHRGAAVGNVVKTHVPLNKEEWKSFAENDPVKLHFERLAELAKSRRKDMASKATTSSKRSGSDIDGEKENSRPKKKARHCTEVIIPTNTLDDAQSSNGLFEEAFEEIANISCNETDHNDLLNDNGTSDDLLGQEASRAAEEQSSSEVSRQDSVPAGGYQSPTEAIFDNIAEKVIVDDNVKEAIVNDIVQEAVLDDIVQVQEATTTTVKESLPRDAPISVVEELPQSQEGQEPSLNLQQSDIPAALNDHIDDTLDRIFTDIIDLSQFSEDNF